MVSSLLAGRWLVSAGSSRPVVRLRPVSRLLLTVEGSTRVLLDSSCIMAFSSHFFFLS